MTSHFFEDDLKRAVLPALLRWRPVTTQEAGEVIGSPEDETRACLSRLAEAGHLVWDGEVIGYRSPEQRAIAEVTGRLGAVRRELAGVENALKELPALVESWAMRSHTDDPHVIEVIRGPVPMAEVWTRQLAWQAPERISLMMPDVVTAAEVGADLDTADAYLREAGVDLRCVLGAHNVPGPEGTFAGIAPSAKVRVHPRVPSWMMVSDGTVVLPMKWGRPDLVDLMLVSDHPLAQAMTDFFDVLWEQSASVPGAERSAEAAEWDALLGVLERGATIESAGRALGLSPRTAQRRVRAAMAHYGAHSQFALGVAWARDRAARQ
jgi:hypothetical protein